MKSALDEYKAVGSLLHKYWCAYGGWRALVCSPYLHLSLLILLVCSNWVLSPEDQTTWYSQVLSILPNLLGFTLGGFTFMLGFGGDRLLDIIAGRSKKGTTEASLYIKVSATFLHFLTVQFLALIFALIANVLNFPPPKWLDEYAKYLQFGAQAWALLGYGLFIYGISLSLAAAMAIFRVSGWIDIIVDEKKEEEGKQKSSE